MKTGSAGIETESLFSASRPFESRKLVTKEYLWHGLIGLVFSESFNRDLVGVEGNGAFEVS